MMKWNNSLVLGLLVFLARGRSIEQSFIKVGCDLQDVYPLEVFFCEPSSKNQTNAEKELKSTVAIGVQCAFKVNDSSISVIKECNDDGWHDKDINNAATAHRDRNSPSIACPYVEPKLADQIQTNRIMNWKEPVAHDNEDGTLIPQRGGAGPGLLFNEGSTFVKYYARDRAGNHNTCIVIVTVKVVRCPAVSPMPDGYYVCHPSNDLVQGATCQFGCYRGHKLSGHQTIECKGTLYESRGHWNNPQPICEKLQCPVLLPAIKPMHMTCTDRNYYRSTCRFSCDPGYDITPGQTRVMLCTENGSWRGAVPICKDSEPPKFTKCLGYQVGYTERGSDDGHIPTFQTPEVTDNIDKNIQPVLTSKTNPKSRIRRGVYMIAYDAVDTAGNKAFGCKIKLVIKMITCPRIYPTADSSITCTTGSRHGSNCEFACSSSAVLNGTKYITCERHNQDGYGYWTWQNQQPFVKRKTEGPDNGAIACDYWLGGSFCHMFCEQEYDVPRGEMVDVNGMFVCGQSGKWNPSASVPNCAKVFKAKSHHYRLNVDFQFTGNCHDSDVVMEIQQQFIETWKTSGFKEGCLHEIKNAYLQIFSTLACTSGKLIFTGPVDKRGIYTRPLDKADKVTRTLEMKTKPTNMDINKPRTLETGNIIVEPGDTAVNEPRTVDTGARDTSVSEPITVETGSRIIYQEHVNVNEPRTGGTIIGQGDKIVNEPRTGGTIIGQGDKIVNEPRTVVNGGTIIGQGDKIVNEPRTVVNGGTIIGQGDKIVNEPRKVQTGGTIIGTRNTGVNELRAVRNSFIKPGDKDVDKLQARGTIISQEYTGVNGPRTVETKGIIIKPGEMDANNPGTTKTGGHIKRPVRSKPLSGTRNGFKAQNQPLDGNGRRMTLGKMLSTISNSTQQNSTNKNGVGSGFQRFIPPFVLNMNIYEWIPRKFHQKIHDGLLNVRNKTLTGNF
ncbi:unnamed protein product [Mytilus edulis]|uniref:Uncharacterized protein n=1 Tax=Mytilus edulis TaxID=6550 RepID=A0A8S3RJK9_MYTED|nr:unnamed protein product [Mytilus edulis]